MRKHRKLILVCACVAALAVFAALHRRNDEPRYGGRSLSEWLALSYSQSFSAHEIASEAIRQIGTNGIPLLLQWMSYDQKLSRPKQIAAALAAKLPVISDWQLIDHWIYSPDPRTARANGAAIALAMLGTNAAPALPELTRMARTGAAPGPGSRALDVLAGIGPSTLPILLEVATNNTAGGQFYALSAMATLGTNARPAIPVLLAQLKHQPFTNKPPADVAAARSGLSNLLSNCENTLRTWQFVLAADDAPNARDAVPFIVGLLANGQLIIETNTPAQ